MLGLTLSPGTGRGGQGAQPQPLASFFAPGAGQHVALAQGPDNNVSIWTEIGPGRAAWMTLDANDPATRWSWRETLVAELRNIYTIRDLALTSGWSKLQSSGSGLAGSYTGNRAISTSSLTATASVTVDRAKPYDVWIHYTGRTNGGYARVDIDGAQTLVTEIDDPGTLGFKAFSTYAPVDLQRRQSVKVAAGLTGSHDITISNGGAATPGGNAILIEAVAISASLADSRILPPVWQSGTTYEMGDEVQLGGLYYSARGNGVSGSTGPVHTGGIASDGALDWRVDNRATYPKFVAIDYASEREYAARVDVSGSVTEIGGQTHGHEPLQSRTITLDDVPWVPETTGTGLSVGASVSITEVTEWQTGAGAAFADCIISRTITPGAIFHNVDVVGTGPVGTFEWLYAGMLPMVAWDGESRSAVVQTIEVPGVIVVALADYDGTSPPNVDFTGARRLGMTATIGGDTLRYGHEAGALAISGNVVDQFDAFLRPNLNGTASGGGLDWQAKAYITGSADDGLTLGAGDALGFFSRHVMQVDPQAS